MYNWHDLVRLAVKDMHRGLGMAYNPDSEFHYIGGTDAHDNPFIRIDLTPLDNTVDKV